MFLGRSVFYLHLLLMMALVLLGPPGAAVAASSPVRVSGDSPFADCATASYGTLYGNAEAEPSVASNPTNPLNLVGAWQQDRWSSGAARGLSSAYSTDGGDSWTEVPLPFTACAQGGLAYDRASDPWVSFGPDGTAYTSAIALGKDGSTAVVAATSTDGGKTWENAREVIVDGGNPRQFFNDKAAITADPTAPGVAYVVWARLESGGGDQESEAQSGAPRASAYFARTGDGGQTWSKPKAITSAGAGEATGNQIVVDPRTGVLYDFFDLIAQSGRGRLSYTIGFVKSLDGGETWREPKNVSDIRMAPVRVPGTRQTVRSGGILPSVAIDPSAGTLYVVWMDSRFASGQYPEVAISVSGDDGESWSAPARVNTPSDGPAFTPSVSVSAGGTVAVTYYDFRNYRVRSSPVLTDVVTGVHTALHLASVDAQAAASLPTDYWATFSTDGGETFGGEVHIAGKFDILNAPNSGGYFLGDYQGLTTGNDAFVSFFVQTASGDRTNRTDVFALSLVEPKPSYIDVH